MQLNCAFSASTNGQYCHQQHGNASRRADFSFDFAAFHSVGLEPEFAGVNFRAFQLGVTELRSRDDCF
jgi:hypothetical protein